MARLLGTVNVRPTPRRDAAAQPKERAVGSKLGAVEAEKE
jgi:hypothetical protein